MAEAEVGPDQNKAELVDSNSLSERNSMSNPTKLKEGDRQRINNFAKSRNRVYKRQATSVVCKNERPSLPRAVCCNVCRDKKIRYSALFTNLVGWYAGSVSFPLSDVILAQLACPLSDVMFCLHSGM